MIYEIEHPNIFEFIKENISEFDTSNFRKDNAHGIPRVNETVVLKMKSETADVPIVEFIALGAKQYAIQTTDDLVMKKARGVKKNILKKHISIDDYKKALFNNEIEICDQTSIQSRNHILYTVKRRKIALKSADDKRVEVENYCTLPHGHYIVEEDKENTRS